MAVLEGEVIRPHVCEVCGRIPLSLMLCHACDRWQCVACWGTMDLGEGFVHCEACRRQDVEA